MTPKVMPIIYESAPPRHAHVDDRAEEEEDDELEQAALHGNILRPTFTSPAAFGATLHFIA